MDPKHENVHTKNVEKEDTETDTKIVVKHEVKGLLLLNDSKTLVKREKTLKPEPSWDGYISPNSSSVKSDVPKTEKEVHFKSEAIHIEHIESKKVHHMFRNLRQRNLVKSLAPGMSRA